MMPDEISFARTASLVPSSHRVSDGEQGGRGRDKPHATTGHGGELARNDEHDELAHAEDLDIDDAACRVSISLLQPQCPIYAYLVDHSYGVCA